MNHAEHIAHLARFGEFLMQRSQMSRRFGIVADQDWIASQVGSFLAKEIKEDRNLDMQESPNNAQ